MVLKRVIGQRTCGNKSAVSGGMPEGRIMKKTLIFLVLINLLISAVFAGDLIGNIKMSIDCSKIYVDNPIEGLSVQFYQTDELYNKVIAIARKYFPDKDPSRIVMVGFDSDGSLNNRGLYATTIAGSVGGKQGKLIHFSTQYLPGGVNDKNFEWVTVHELIHVFYDADVDHVKPECIKVARSIEAKYKMHLKYGKY